jgi:hypothetical protein
MSYTKEELEQKIKSIEALRKTITFSNYTKHIQGAFLFRLGFFKRKLREVSK